MLVWYMLSTCVCLYCILCLLYCIKMAKHRIMQIVPHDGSGTLSFLMPKITTKFERDHSLRGQQMQVGWIKISNVRRKTCYNLKTVQDRCIVSIIVE